MQILIEIKPLKAYWLPKTQVLHCLIISKFQHKLIQVCPSIILDIFESPVSPSGIAISVNF